MRTERTGVRFVDFESGALDELVRAKVLQVSEQAYLPILSQDNHTTLFQDNRTPYPPQDNCTLLFQDNRISRQPLDDDRVALDCRILGERAFAERCTWLCSVDDGLGFKHH